MSAESLSLLRQRLRQQRRQLSPQQQHHAAQQLSKRLCHHPLFLRSQHIAVYLPHRGEMSLHPLIKRAWSMGKRCYLPVLKAHKPALWFIPYTPETPLKNNRFGIPEPRHLNFHHARPAWAFDLVLTPLVGFDNHGQRLGMGGGFYDRSFAYILKSQQQRRCPLWGVAYDIQHISRLPIRTWDVPLSGVCTQTGIYKTL